MVRGSVVTYDPTKLIGNCPNLQLILFSFIHRRNFDVSRHGKVLLLTTREAHASWL